MAAKNKKHPRRPGVDQLYEQAEKNLSRGNHRQALKDAKVCYRQQPNERNRGLLERVYFARARELQRAGLRSEGRAVVENLQDLGVTEPTVRRELPELMVSLGMLDQKTASSLGAPAESNAALMRSAADHAVLYPNEVATALPGMRQGSEAVRRSLSALAEGADAQATTEIGAVASDDPFADWWHFVRGLAAYYARDHDAMEANWDRLDPKRPAARIAMPLRSLAVNPRSAGSDPRVKAALERLGRHAFGHSVISSLAELGARANEQQWGKVIGLLSRFGPSFRRFDPALPGRITDALYREVVHRASWAEMVDFARVCEPLSIDPRWNRAYAMAQEDSWDCDGDIDEADQYWRRYLRDLADMPGLSDAERTLASSLVWLHLGEIWIAEAEDVQEGLSLDDEVERYRARAVDCLEQSIQLDPTLSPAYEALADAHDDWEQDEQAAAAYGRLLEHHPDHIGALRYLAEHHCAYREPLVAREYALRAQRAQPLDRNVARLLREVHSDSARHFAERKDWDRGREELAAVGRLSSRSEAVDFAFASQQAAFEFKAGDRDAANRIIASVEDRLPEPAPMLLALSIEAHRYGLSAKDRNGFARQWRSALKAKCVGATAGAMCATMADFLDEGIEFSGQEAFVEDLVSYVRRSYRVRYRRDEVRAVCEFLEEVPDEVELLEKFVRKGKKNFPDAAYFHHMTGEMEMDKGPYECNRRQASRCFEFVVESARASGDPRDAELVDNAKRRLTFLRDAGIDQPAYAGPAAPFDLPVGLPAHVKEMMNVVLEICERTGLDPEEVLNGAAGEMPDLPFRADDDGKTKQKRKGSRAKR